MRTQTFKTRLSAWMFAPLLVACGSEGSGGGGELVTIPDCTSKPGSVLSTDKNTGGLICKDLPAGAVSLPNCKPDSEALTSDGKTVFCTNRNNETSDSRMALENISNSETLIKDYGTRYLALGSGPGAKAYFVGLTSDAPNALPNVTGSITSGADVGLVAAATICASKFGAGARMCNVYDIYHSLGDGKITPNKDIAKSWVYMESWKNPVAGSTEPTAGMGDNCGGYTQNAAAKNWAGTAFSYATVTFTSTYAPKFFSGSDAALGALCTSSLPIACCK